MDVSQDVNPDLLRYKEHDQTELIQNSFITTSESVPLGSKTLLVVIPVLNEARLLVDNTVKLKEYLTKTGLNFTICLYVDPSSDNSMELAKELSSSSAGRVVTMAGQKPVGRGFAVREAWRSISSDFYCFMDADLAADIGSTVEVLGLLATGKADVVIGSRYVNGSIVHRPPLRRKVSEIYNGILRLIFRDEVFDHQCGYKFLNHRATQLILRTTDVDSWFWDTELVVVSRFLKLKMIEYPVTWRELKHKKTSMRRLISDIIIHGGGIIYLAGKVPLLKMKASLYENAFRE